MSLFRESCQNCWLPPITQEGLCRKCERRSRPAPFSKNDSIAATEWIRNHTSDPAQCCAFRKYISTGAYTGVVLPEECQHCCAFLFSLHPIKYPVERNAMIWSIVTTPCDILAKRFKRWLAEDKVALLYYLNEIMSYFLNSNAVCLKIVNALLQSVEPSRKFWILEELVAQPQYYPELLSGFVPAQFAIDFWQTTEEDASLDEYLLFWLNMRAAVKRRIKFRSLKIKEQLMMEMWHPRRVAKKLEAGIDVEDM